MNVRRLEKAAGARGAVEELGSDEEFGLEEEDEYEPLVAETAGGVEDEEQDRRAEDEGEEARNHGVAGEEAQQEEPGVRDFWEAPNLRDGTVRRVHALARQRLYVPTAQGLPWFGQVGEERRTILINHRGVRVRVDDNWRQAGEVDIGYGLWTGFTIFPLRDVEVSWDRWENYGWGEDGSYEDDEEEPEEENEDEEPSSDTRGGGTPEDGPGTSRRSPSSSTYKAPHAEAKAAADEYTDAVEEFGNTASGWATVVQKGNKLVKAAGSIQQAAESLWEVREERGLMNLASIDHEEFDAVLHPDNLQYLRQVRKFGMPARYAGARHRVSAKLHPNAKRNLSQIFHQVAKDVRKHRVLAMDSLLPELGPTVSHGVITV